MITYPRGSIRTVLAQQELLELQYAELTRNKDVAKLAPDYERYYALEDAGCLLVLLAVQDNARVLGYSVFLVDRHLHYKGMVVAMNDLLYLHPDHRGGMTGVRLIRESERQCKHQGAKKILWHAKEETMLHTLLRFGMRYETEEIILAKVI